VNFSIGWACNCDQISRSVSESAVLMDQYTGQVDVGEGGGYKILEAVQAITRSFKQRVCKNHVVILAVFWR
jgi:hypothetical protein